MGGGSKATISCCQPICSVGNCQHESIRDNQGDSLVNMRKLWLLLWSLGSNAATKPGQLLDLLGSTARGSVVHGHMGLQVKRSSFICICLVVTSSVNLFKQHSCLELVPATFLWFKAWLILHVCETGGYISVSRSWMNSTPVLSQNTE